MLFVNDTDIGNIRARRDIRFLRLVKLRIRQKTDLRFHIAEVKSVRRSCLLK